MRCAHVDGKSPKKLLDDCVGLLAEAAEEKGAGRSAEELAALARGGGARLIVVYDDQDHPVGLCLFNVQHRIDGPCVWVNEFLLRFDDHENEVRYSDFLGRELIRWAKENGCAGIAGAAEGDDMEMRELARILEMETRRMVLMERRL